MRISIAGMLWFVSLSCLAQSPQTQQQRPRPATQDGGVREVLESIVIPPIRQAPFTATLATEATKYTADGGTMTFVNQRHIARNAEGRIYEERWYLVPKGSNVKSMNWIQIADPKQHTLYNCSPQRHICDLLVYNPESDLQRRRCEKVPRILWRTARAKISGRTLELRIFLGSRPRGFAKPRSRMWESSATTNRSTA